MRKAPGLTEIGQCKTVEALQRALDQAYRQLLETAIADWQHLFTSPDRPDSCVTVRISSADIAQELAGIPRAGLIPVSHTKLNGHRVRRRLA